MYVVVVDRSKVSRYKTYEEAEAVSDTIQSWLYAGLDPDNDDPYETIYAEVEECDGEGLAPDLYWMDCIKVCVGIPLDRPEKVYTVEYPNGVFDGRVFRSKEIAQICLERLGDDYIMQESTDEEHFLILEQQEDMLYVEEPVLIDEEPIYYIENSDGEICGSYETEDEAYRQLYRIERENREAIEDDYGVTSELGSAFIAGFNYGTYEVKCEYPTSYDNAGFHGSKYSKVK